MIQAFEEQAHRSEGELEVVSEEVLANAMQSNIRERQAQEHDAPVAADAHGNADFARDSGDSDGDSTT